MSSFSRNGSSFGIICGPNGAVIRTEGPGEQPKIIDLEGRYPYRLRKKLEEAINPTSTRYGGVTFNLPKQTESQTLMVVPDDQEGERWVHLYWMVRDPNNLSTFFEIRLRVNEVKNLLRYMDELMTC